MSHDADQTCGCVADHRPPYLELEHHHIWPKEFGGPTVPENMIWICDTTHTNTHELLRLMLKAQRELTDRELQALESRSVSRYAASLARLGFRRVTARALVD